MARLLGLFLLVLASCASPEPQFPKSVPEGLQPQRIGIVTALGDHMTFDPSDMKWAPTLSTRSPIGELKMDERAAATVRERLRPGIDGVPTPVDRVELLRHRPSAPAGMVIRLSARPPEPVDALLVLRANKWNPREDPEVAAFGFQNGDGLLRKPRVYALYDMVLIDARTFSVIAALSRYPFRPMEGIPTTRTFAARTDDEQRRIKDGLVQMMEEDIAAGLRQLNLGT